MNGRSKEGKSDPQLAKGQNQKEKYHPEKQLSKEFTQTADSHLDFLSSTTILYFELLSCSYVIIKNVISTGIESRKQTWFLLAKKRQSNRRLFSQSVDFDQDIIIGNAASERQENITFNESSNDPVFTVGTSTNNLAVNENTVKVNTLKRCFDERIDREMSNIVDTLEDRI